MAPEPTGEVAAAPVPLPDDVARERSVLVHRVLRDLPLPLLEPLLRGLRRHADSLAPGSLYREQGPGGCAVGMMLRELNNESTDDHGGSWLRRRRATRRRRRAINVWEERPDLAKAHPRLTHLELIFDNTCEAVQSRTGAPSTEAARSVGLWVAAETQAEINLRHVEEAAEADARPLPLARLDERLLADTVARLRDLRPWLAEAQAVRLVHHWIGARPASAEPWFVPDGWVAEAELQRQRLAGVGA